MVRQWNKMNAQDSVFVGNRNVTKQSTSVEFGARRGSLKPSWLVLKPAMLVIASLLFAFAAGCGPEIFGASTENSAFDPAEVQIEDVSEVKLTPAGSALLIKLDNGTVLGCGNNNSGLLGTGQTGKIRSELAWMEAPDGSRISGVSQVAAYSGSSYVLMDDGSILAYGSNINGALGHGVEEYLFASFEPRGVHVIDKDGQPLKDVVQVGAGLSFGLAITNIGDVLAWGSNLNGQQV